MTILTSFLENIVSMASPNSSFAIQTTILPNTDKSFLRSVYICPYETTFILPHALPILALDCAILKGEINGVLYHASTFDGNNHVIPLAFMLAEEESTAGWTSFVDQLESDQIMPGHEEYSVIRQLCHTLDQLLSKISQNYPNIVSSSSSFAIQSTWNPFGSARRLKTKGSSLHYALRALIHRVVFSRSSQFSGYVNQLADQDEALWDSLRTACCYRHGHDNNHDYFHDPINMCIQQFEEYYLQKRFLSHLMIDDVISGLYEMIASESLRRRRDFSQYNSTQLTPSYQQLEEEYSSISSFMITSPLLLHPSTPLPTTTSTPTPTPTPPPPPSSSSSSVTTTTTVTTTTIPYSIPISTPVPTHSSSSSSSSSSSLPSALSYHTPSSIFALSSSEYECIRVMDTQRQVEYRVNLVQRTCSCGTWENNLFPCIHCWVVLQKLDISVEAFTKGFYTCGNVIQMNPEYVLPSFPHVLSKQVDLFLQQHPAEMNCHGYSEGWDVPAGNIYIKEV